MDYFRPLPQLVPVNAMAGIEGFRQAQQDRRQSELERLQIDAARRRMTDEDARRGALSDYFRQESPELAGVAQASPEAAMELHRTQATLGSKELRKAKELFDFGMTMLPHITHEMYPAFREDMARRGLNMQLLPEQFGSPQEFEQWKVQTQRDALPIKERLDIELKQAEFNKPSYHSYQEGDETVSTRYTPGSGEEFVGRGTRRPLAETTVNMPHEKQENKSWGEFLVKNDYGTIDERAKSAEQLIEQFEIARNIDITTGRFEPLKAQLNSIIEGFGFDSKKWGLDQADNAQALTGILQNVVLTKMQAQKGPQTENDAKRIESTVASLKNTPEAFKFLLNASQALEERVIEQRDFYLAHKERTGSFDGAAQEWNRYKRQTPLIGKNPDNGLPVFFNEYKRRMLAQYPGATEEEILQNWRVHFAK